MIQTTFSKKLHSPRMWLTSCQVPRADVPDMPDRIVAATGLYFGIPVISRDRRIRASNIQTVW
jgi:PIN domain nuclease of toxin-antitoxin system